MTSPANSTIPTHVLVVGRTGALADTTFGMFTIVARDLANNPQFNRLIEFRLENCGGFRLAIDALQPGVSTSCATHGITAVTDIQGSVRMAVIGGGTPGSAPGSGPCAQVYSRGVFLGLVSVAWLDLDGSAGVGANDLSLWLTDKGLAEPISRSDYDGNGVLDANDLSIWMEVCGRGQSVESAGAYCP